MSDTTNIVEKYAKAAFRISKNAKSQNAFIEDLSNFCSNFDSLKKDLSNPTISKIQLEEIVKEIAKKLKISQEVLSFIIEVSRSRRLSLIGKIHKRFQSLIKKDQNIIEAEIISAKNLQESQLNEAKKIIETKYPKSKIELSQRIDEKIIGGIVIKIDSLVIDGSVKNQLSNLYAECKSAIYNINI